MTIGSAPAAVLICLPVDLPPGHPDTASCARCAAPVRLTERRRASAPDAVVTCVECWPAYLDRARPW